MSKRTLYRSAALPVLLAGLSLTSPAARAAPEHVSISVINAPVAAVLRTLFGAAGVRKINLDIDADVQGRVSVDILDVPFPVALRQVLGAVSPPLTFTIDNAAYHVQVQRPVPPISETRAAALATPAPEGAGQERFYKIGVRHYDPGVIARLMTQPSGIIEVPPNFVLPSGANAPAANAVLPDGVQRIFALHSDNSLVIEAAPDGLARLLPDTKEPNP